VRAKNPFSVSEVDETYDVLFTDIKILKYSLLTNFSSLRKLITQVLSHLAYFSRDNSLQITCR